MHLYWDKLLNPIRNRIAPTVEKSENDLRSEFKKDFDAVCNSTMLRRLQDKAQVFPLEDGDYARTRLTHSIEAMSIADSLGMNVVQVIKEHREYWSTDQAYTREPYVLSLINEVPMILKTVALLHDMGNPPFGHLGEQIIGDWFSDHLNRLAFDSNNLLVDKGETAKTLSVILGDYHLSDLKSDLTHFDGNAQLFRLVNRLNFIVDENGLNLTYPVMSAFIKYPSPSSAINKNILLQKKIGYFSSEKELFQKLNEELCLDSYRHPLAFLLEAADDIAYLTADFEDAHKKGLISINMVKQYLLNEQEKCPDSLIENVLRAIEEYIEKASSIGYSDVENYVAHRIRVLMKGLMISKVTSAFQSSYHKIMEKEFDEELLKVSGAARLSDILRKIQAENIYYSPHILKNKIRAFTVIKTLLDSYVPAVLNWDEAKDQGRDTANNLIYQSFSKNYRFACKKAIDRCNDLPENEKFAAIIYYKLLLVTDQISGMTDTHALSVYHDIVAG